VIIRLIESEYQRQQEELAYRVYVTDTLRVLTENTAKFAGGMVIKANYYDIINKKNQQQDTRSGEEIVADIINRAGLELA
jgi:hypothetical protein